MVCAFILGWSTVPDPIVRPVTINQTKYIEVPAQSNLGASLDIPTVKALFETTLAANITSSATTFTLTSALDKEGSTLASSTYPFIIDEGTANEEMVIADCTATACTNATRGISVLSGTTSVTSLKKSHRRGATVKITDGPQLMILTRILNGIGTFPNIIRYTSHPTFSGLFDIVDKKYVDDTAFSGAGVIDATTLARGVGELATGCEAASSTASGGSGVLLIPASLATSTWYSASLSGCKVIVADNLGKIDSNFVSTTTLFSSSFSAGTTTISGSLTLTGGNSTSNIASTSIRAFTASTTPTTTWTKPGNIKFVIIEVVGGGGGGGGVGNSGNYGAGGGGGGGYCKKVIPAAALGSTESVAVGGAGAAGAANSNDGGAGGTSFFGSHCTAGGGAGGAGASGSNGVSGGTGTSGDINVSGGGGGPTATAFSGEGGDSMFGRGSVSRARDLAGGAGSSYGGGGSGSFCDASCTADAGGAGAVGAVFVTEVYY
mgnify:CR=1 FL=1